MADLKEAIENKRTQIASQPATLAPYRERVRVGERERSILAIIGLDPDNPISHAVVAVADRYGLDPVLGHIQVIKNGLLPYITRDGYLDIAHRSGHFNGMETVDKPHREGAEWVATVAVYRDDMTHPFTYTGWADVSADNAHARDMAIARAERRALKRAFNVSTPRAFAEDEEDDRPAPAPAPQARQQITDVELPFTEDAEPDPDWRAQPVGRKDIAAIKAAYRDLDIPDRHEQLAETSHILGHDIGSHNELNRGEAADVVARLAERRQDRDLGRDEPPAETDDP
jgi:hypothetical protein